MARGQARKQRLPSGQRRSKLAKQKGAALRSSSDDGRALVMVATFLAISIFSALLFTMSRWMSGDKIFHRVEEAPVDDFRTPAGQSESGGAVYRADSAASSSTSTVALLEMLDAQLTTPLARRHLVDRAAVAELLVNPAVYHQPGSQEISSDTGGANPDAVRAITVGTHGGLSALGYAMLLHDPSLVEMLLLREKASGNISVEDNFSSGSGNSTGHASPLAAVSRPPSVSSVTTAHPPPRALSAAHESALYDGLKPLQLSLLTKDLVVESARRYLAQGSPGQPRSSEGEIPEVVSAANTTTLDSVLQELRRQLARTRPQAGGFGKGGGWRQKSADGDTWAPHVSAAAIRLAVHEVVTKRMLRAVFESLWGACYDERRRYEHVESDTPLWRRRGGRAVVVALLARDRFSRSALHLAVLSGDIAATAMILEEWTAASEAASAVENSSSGGGDDDVPTTAVADTLGEERIVGGVHEVSCLLLTQVDQLNRTALHFAAMRGDVSMFRLLQHFDETQRVEMETTGRVARDTAENSCGALVLRDVNQQTAKEILDQLRTADMVEATITAEGAPKKATARKLKRGIFGRNKDVKVAEGNKERKTAAITSGTGEGRDLGNDDDSGGWTALDFDAYTNKELSDLSSDSIFFCDFDVVNSTSLTARDFLLGYLAKSKPVLVQGGADNWAFRSKAPLKMQGRQTTAAVNQSNPQRWTLDAFLSRFGTHRVTAALIPYAASFGLEAQALETTIAEYIALVSNTSRNDSENEQALLYIFSDLPHSSMLGDFPVAGPPWLHLTPRLVDSVPAAIQFFVGPRGSGSPMHWHSDSWNALAFGLKEWALLPPARARFSRTLESSDFGLRSEGGNHWKDDGRALRCLQRPGDIVYIPATWSHTTRNLRASVGVAVEFRYTFNHFV